MLKMAQTHAESLSVLLVLLCSTSFGSAFGYFLVQSLLPRRSGRLGWSLTTTHGRGHGCEGGMQSAWPKLESAIGTVNKHVED